MGKRTIIQEWQRVSQEAREKWQKAQKREKLMLAVAGIFLMAGFVFLLAPTSAEKHRLKEQQQLTEVILSGEAMLEVKNDVFDGVLDFYGEDSQTLDVFGDPPQEKSPNTTTQEKAENKKVTQIAGLGILEIEKINLRIPVADGASKTTLKVAAGHVRETAGIGQQGNAVIAAHRSYTKGQFFNRLDELTIGDIVKYSAKDGDVYSFEVIEIQTLEPSDVSVFDIREGKHDLTLYTCTPVRVASHRLAIRCCLIEKITSKTSIN